MAIGPLLPAGLLHAKLTPPADIRTICDRMVATDDWRTRTLLGYTVMRRYTLEVGDVRRGEMLVRVEYTHPGHKTFHVISKNSGYLQDEVFHHLIDAELDAARDEVRDSVRIIPLNYNFTVLGTDDLDGRPAYVMRVTPRRRHRFAVDGRIWVDAAEAAVAKIDGEVHAGSFWVRCSHMVQTYRKIGPYWLVVSNRNDAGIRLFGEAHLRIDYFDYRVRAA